MCEWNAELQLTSVDYVVAASKCTTFEILSGGWKGGYVRGGNALDQCAVSWHASSAWEFLGGGGLCVLGARGFENQHNSRRHEHDMFIYKCFIQVLMS